MTAVYCQHGTDGFVLVANARLPDTSLMVTNENLGWSVGKLIHDRYDKYDGLRMGWLRMI